ncbi:dihydrolipoamide dehydrogenase [Siccirubricoccus deserti]|uniref:FAD-dependent oxidoreductase n=1 Tax=Siccirubricoccus deserti TaxID=2013562 RepID=A0A9X0R246_9PROT|nr:FAD-dependent oxidoreductase [Siccirubricoccus deserti]MBC4016907.1 FAD-dependent oxidoreductase [Siccirubricoccus deserti]GGC53674.1 dihydrolipoamide dehydrogenase [Siccirubricoccus deserti]
MPDVDVAVIGAGAAGLSVAAICNNLGLKVALIERGRMGGDCLNYGCVPSKALLAAGHAAAEARAAARFGIRLPPPEIDWAGVRAHVRGAIERIAPNDSAERFRGMGVDVIEASAHFLTPDTLEVGGRQLRFRRCVIAAGSSAVIPDIPGLDGVPWLTNETLFELEEPPGHLIILGGGPIGLEMAQAHARLGCLVTVLEAAPRIAPREDAELVEGLRAALLRDGVEIREAAKVVAVEPLEARSETPQAGVVAVLEDGSRIAGTHLLLAIGRAPRLASLDLAAGGIAASPRGVATQADLRSTSNRRVWAVGDIADPEGIGPRAFTHVASQHAGIVVRSMLFRLPFTRVDYAALPRVTYTDPELAQVGLTEAEARERGIAGLAVHRWPLGENDRAIAEARPEGLVKLVVDGRGRLVGAGVLAPRAGEMAGMFGLMIGRRLPLSALAGLVLPYPTLAEAAKRAAGEYYAPKLLSAGVKRVVALLRHLP